jgi:hypothetical protein
MTKFEQLQLQVRAQAKRIEALEAAVAARPTPHKRERAPRADDRDIAGREELWATYLRLEMTHGHGRTKLSKLSFAIRHRLSPDEFVRWFSATDKRGVPAGSKPDRSHRRALADAIAELEARGENNSRNPRISSHGNGLPSQFSASHLH